MHGLKEVDVICPYCGQSIDIIVDTTLDAQEYYEDCPVCCAPILFLLSVDETGEIYLDLKRDDE
ncbi:CPXCG motif-containing cysteine-rich protein [Methylobacter luteus]|uniref:CPXCG motif-containing cysteine-rich protein n=1 Tax=Methylobacter luteus TaxID=415 RepID=UPI0004151CE2|nr:CPXCG motif-containing cysteine-rich protein [Methylobacter luteus]